MLIPLSILSVLASPLLPLQAQGLAATRKTPTLQQGSGAPLRALQSRPRRVVPTPLRQDLIDPLTITVNGASVPATPVSSLPALPHGPGWFNLSTPVPNQSVPELFVLGLPDMAVAGPGKRPLLVVFHQFNVSQGDAILNTEFLAETQARGWYLLGPLSRSPVGNPTINYGSKESQEFTRAGLDWVLDNYPIDRSRIYGVGFSMGGAAATSFAARHMDPKAGMFAALVDHTGSVDQVDTYTAFLQQGAEDLLETIFGGGPVPIDYKYRRSSCIELDPNTLDVLSGGTHMAINLTHVPTQFWWATGDSLTYLVNQTEEFASLLGSFPGAVVDLNPVQSAVHSWDTMPAVDVCDWLDGQQLSVPLQGRIITDHDGRWYHFDVTADVPDDFAAFGYELDPAIGLISIMATEGIQSIGLDLRDWGTATSDLPLTIKFDALDSGDVLVIKGISTSPGSVTRDGVATSVGWFHNPFADTLTVAENFTGTHTWTFLP
ncbi:MAG: hypothetical protein ACI8QC_001196 [Planctomycetota bacterium]|jgi:hypothetical protein